MPARRPVETAIGGAATETTTDALERVLRRHRGPLLTLLASSNDVLLVVDPAGTIVHASDGVTSILGWEPEQLVGRPIDAVMVSSKTIDDLGAFVPPGEFGSIVSEDTESVNIACESAGGDVVPLQFHGGPIHSSNGEVEQFVCVGNRRPVTEGEAAQLVEQVDNLSLTNQTLCHELRNEATLLVELCSRASRAISDDDGTEISKTIENIQEGADRIISLTEAARELVEALERDTTYRHPVEIGNILNEEVALAATRQEGTEIAFENTVSGTEVWANELLGSLFQRLIDIIVAQAGNEHDSLTIAAETRSNTVDISLTLDGFNLAEPAAAMLSHDSTDLAEPLSHGFEYGIIRTLIQRYEGDITVTDDAEPTITVTLARVVD